MAGAHFIPICHNDLCGFIWAILSHDRAPFLTCLIASFKSHSRNKSICSAKFILMSPLLGKVSWVVFLGWLKCGSFLYLAAPLLQLLSASVVKKYLLSFPPYLSNFIRELVLICLHIDNVMCNGGWTRTLSSLRAQIPMGCELHKGRLCTCFDDLISQTQNTLPRI